MEKKFSPTLENNYPWYKELWAWLVFAPILIVVPVSLVTVFIAFKYSDDVVNDDYNQQGRLVENDFAAEHAAGALGIKGELFFNREKNEVSFAVSRPTSRNLDAGSTEFLMLMLSHPVSAYRDREIPLHFADENNYSARLDSTLTGTWYVIITAYPVGDSLSHLTNWHDSPALWRLHGHLNLSESTRLTLDN